jgi:hypothetical protein
VDPNLEALAACRDHPFPEWWWPEKGNGAVVAAMKAKRTCAQCPVIRPCLEATLSEGSAHSHGIEEHGIRGGAGGQLRRWLRRSFVAGGEVWEEAFSTHLARLDGELVRVNMNGPGATHGLPVTYARGCRCGACTLAVGDRDLRLDVVGDRSSAVEIAQAQADRVPAMLISFGDRRVG